MYYTQDETDTGVGSGRRRRHLDRHEFRFSISLWDLFVTELRDSVVFSVLQTVTES